MRQEYRMTEEDKTKLLEACKPTRCMKIGDYAPPSPQENANIAWNILGKKMGFIGSTVQPVVGKSIRYFSAEEAE